MPEQPRDTPFHAALAQAAGADPSWEAEVLVRGTVPDSVLARAAEQVRAAWAGPLGADLRFETEESAGRRVLRIGLPATWFDARSVDLAVEAVARACAGSAPAPLDPTLVEDYVAWQWEVEHDVPGPQEHGWLESLRDREVTGAGDGDGAGGTAVVTLPGAAGPERLLAAAGRAVARFGQHTAVLLGVDTDGRGPDELRGRPGPFSKTLPLPLDGSVATGGPECGRAVDSALRLAAAVADGAQAGPVRGMLADPRLVRVTVCPALPHAVGDSSLTLHRLTLTGGGPGLQLVALLGRAEVVAVWSAGRGCSQRRLDGLAGALAMVWRDLQAPDVLSAAERQLALGTPWRPDTDGSTVCRRWLRAAQAAPDRVALRDEEGSWTHGELTEVTAALAAGLRHRGVGPGDTVLLAMPRGRRAIAAALAALRLGAAFLATEKATDRQVDDLAAAAAARLVLGDGRGPAGAVDWDELATTAAGEPDGAAGELDRAEGDALAYLIGRGPADLRGQ
jgi:hypothetical protein